MTNPRSNQPFTETIKIILLNLIGHEYNDRLNNQLIFLILINT